MVCRGLPSIAARELSLWARSAVIDAGTEIPLSTRGEVLVIVSGIARAEIQLDADRRQITRFRYAGDVLQPGVVNGISEICRTIAVTPCILCRIPREAIEDVGQRHPKVRERQLLIATSEAQSLARHTAVVGRLTAMERLATFLLELSTRTGRERSDGAITFRLPMTREDIADHLGLNVETVSRNLTRMKKEGLLELPKPSSGIISSLHDLRAWVPFAD